MKIFQHKHQEILFNDGLDQEESFIEQYRDLFETELRIHHISQRKIYEAFDVPGGNITSKPFIIASLLRKDKLPPFHFLAGKN